MAGLFLDSPHILQNIMVKTTITYWAFSIYRALLGAFCKSSNIAAGLVLCLHFICQWLDRHERQSKTLS